MKKEDAITMAKFHLDPCSPSNTLYDYHTCIIRNVFPKL